MRPADPSFAALGASAQLPSRFVTFHQTRNYFYENNIYLEIKGKNK